LLVKVSVSVNMTARNAEQERRPRRDAEGKSTHANESEPIRVRVATEPGAQPNMGASIDHAAARPNRGEKIREENDTELRESPDRRRTDVKPAGEGHRRSAPVACRAATSSNGQDAVELHAEPTLARFSPSSTRRLGEDPQRRRELHRDQDRSASRCRCTTTSRPSLPRRDGRADVARSARRSTLQQGIAVGALALVSLFMVSMMVRKGTPAPVVAAAPVPRETPHLAGIPEVAGIVSHGESMLDGMELDEDTVRTQQMLDQVSTLVGENPEAAANLVKRWLNRT
jgi:hypothetical protein